ncbi:methylated-DNA--[protein]-cysteine S-methyltransferase [Candidatus Parcubacteria bacterium]|jgi:methylated-DNA-[protein]-cysteine S-methyltransferase|nr:methylated-DNA--[protein]-cysteine S-methyltransferase [Candidatus Parcubacteria bacterium]MBT7228947.1 methylated-DNA--[protein]-cysteine S-methyltransferase [Candidatus Parcubacteria bacterium]
MFREYYKSPLGYLGIVADDDSILGVEFVTKSKNNKSNALTKKCVVQLKQYFAGKRKVFDLPLGIDGTGWQKKVWQNLLKVSFGNTISYGELAKLAANPRGARAVGGAVNKNKIPIIIPCHRVVGSTGKMVGYEGGLWRKEKLLKLEGLTI